jgi:hypothetical protein
MTYFAELNGIVLTSVNATYSSNLLTTTNTNIVQNRTITASTQFCTIAPTAIFSLNSTTIPQTLGTNIAISEVAFLLVNITVPEGSIYNVELVVSVSKTTSILAVVSFGGIINTMPPNIMSSNFAEGDVINGTDTNLNSIPDMLTFNFSTISNYETGLNQSIFVKIITLVVDIPDNQDGDVLTTTALSYSNSQGGFSISNPILFFTIVKPMLLVNNTTNPNTNIQAGNIINYNLTI